MRRVQERSILNMTHQGDCRHLLPEFAAAGVKVRTCVTSPPYFGLRDYGADGQIGLELSPDEYIAELVSVFGLVRNVLTDDGTLWLNLGDSYNAYNGGVGPSSSLSRGAQTEQRPQLASGYGLKVKSAKPKDLLGIPWRVALALQAHGWWLRSDIIWHKPNPMPESISDRPTKSHEYLFLLAKSERYFCDMEAIKEDGSLQRSGNTQHKYVNGQQIHRTKSGFLDMRQKVYEKVNRRTVWTVPTEPFTGAHFACFPKALIEPCVLAGAAAGDVVLDPFMGSGTVAEVATNLGRQFIGCELNAEYIKLHDLRKTTQGFAFSTKA